MNFPGVGSIKFYVILSYLKQCWIENTLALQICFEGERQWTHLLELKDGHIAKFSSATLNVN